MKKFKTRRELHEYSKATRSIFQVICHAMEIANRADHLEAKKANEGEEGNKPDWAWSVWKPLRDALDVALKDVYGVTIGDLEIEWSGSFWNDIKEALVKALVEEEVQPN